MKTINNLHHLFCGVFFFFLTLFFCCWFLFVSLGLGVCVSVFLKMLGDTSSHSSRSAEKTSAEMVVSAEPQEES